jgi:hypothetical protein
MGGSTGGGGGRAEAVEEDEAPALDWFWRRLK